MNIFRYSLDDLPFVFLAILIAFTLHEFSHAYFANKFGDPTAKNQGRVTLNPRAHLDLIGTILIFIAGFGWAKPVPVNRANFRNPKLMGVIVSAAGPLSNLLIAFVAMLIVYVLVFMGALDSMNEGVFAAIGRFFYHLIFLNLMLFIFNLIPLPPLDGYRIVEDLAPQRVRARLSQYEQWAIFIFLLMVFIPPVRSVTLDPIFSLINNIFFGFNDLLRSWFGQGVNWLNIFH